MECGNPTKHLCIIVPAPLWYLNCTNFMQWWRKCTYFGKCALYIGANLASKSFKNRARTASSNGTWDECSEHHQHQKNQDKFKT